MYVVVWLCHVVMFVMEGREVPVLPGMCSGLEMFFITSSEK